MQAKQLKWIRARALIFLPLLLIANATYWADFAIWEKIFSTLEDTKFIVRDAVGKAPELSPEVIIVTVDEPSVNHYGRWPWDRKILAELLQKLEQASVVGLDIVFSEKTNPESDARLAEAFEDNDNVIAGFFFRNHATDQLDEVAMGMLEECSLNQFKVEGDYIGLDALQYAELSIDEVLQNAMTCASLNIRPDVDGLYRHYPLAHLYAGQLFPSIGLQAYRYHTNEDLILSLDQDGIDEASIGGNYFYDQNDFKLNYYPDYRYQSVVDVMQNADPAEYAGKVVLVGVTEMGVFDIRPTPINPITPGIALHATAFSNLIQNEPIRNSSTLELFVLNGGLILFALLQGVKRIALRGVLYTILLASVLFFSYLVFIVFDVWVTISYTLIFSIVLVFMLELQTEFVSESQAKMLKNAFSNYVSEDLVAELMKHPEEISLGGVDKEVTVLFSDIRGFTHIAESLPSSKVVCLLNLYLEPMTDVVLHYQGYLDKYIGDALLAVFNIPIDIKNHQDRACHAALEMQRRLPIINRQLAENGLPEVDIGIGLNSGIATVGNIGSTARLHYTSIGDTTNLASRIESITKEYAVQIIASEHTVSETSDPFLFRRLDLVQVKGKKDAVWMYELMQDTAENRKIAEHYASAYDFYIKRDFDRAVEAWRELYIQFEDPPSLVMYLRARKYQIDAPETTWRHIYVLDKK